jgi:branched-chain amino acid transport system substrate-binding protein
LHISFEEVTAFFTAAAAYDVLDDIRWFGSDGTAQSGAMTEDPTVAAFAAAVGYPCTIFAPAKSAKWEMVRQNGQTVLGRDPDSYSYAIYDIVWAYALSIAQGDSIDVTAVRDNMLAPGVLTNYYGASGSIDLDANGDRKAGNYYIWEITEADDEYSWTLAGTWILSTDSVMWE